MRHGDPGRHAHLAIPRPALVPPGQRHVVRRAARGRRGAGHPAARLPGRPLRPARGDAGRRDRARGAAGQRPRADHPAARRPACAASEHARTRRSVPSADPRAGSASSRDVRRPTTRTASRRLELFFDLVFVFALTQVTALMAARPELAQPARGPGDARAAVVRPGAATPGWATRRRPTRVSSGPRWCSRWRRCSWSRCHPRGLRATTAGGLITPSCWRSPSAVVRAASISPSTPWPPGTIAGCAAAAGPDRAASSAPRMLLVVGAVLGGVAQTALWAAGARRRLRRHLRLGGAEVAANVAGALRRAARADHHHRARRVDRRDRRRASATRPSPARSSSRSLLGLVVAVGLWWAYFDVVAPVAEQVLAPRRGPSGSGSPATHTPTCTSRWSPASSTWRWD